LSTTAYTQRGQGSHPLPTNQTAMTAAPLSPAPHISAKDWDKSLAINVAAAHRLIYMVEPLLTAADAGRAVFFDDPRAGEKFFGAYGATKAAQIALARSWQSETTRTGPRIDIVTPEPMPTAVRGRFFPGEDRKTLTPIHEEAKRILRDLGLT